VIMPTCGHIQWPTSLTDRDRSDRIYKFKDNDDEPHFWPKITNIATRKWADWPII